MKTLILFFTTMLTLSFVTACSPPDDTSNNAFGNPKQTLDKAKAVEQINMGTKQHIDETLKAAES